jgi:hypothetical protein
MLVAFHRFMHLDGLTDLCVRTAENPGDTGVRQFHPLTTNIMEAPKAKGGLRMAKTLLSYCKLEPGAYQKHTNIWCDCPDVLQEIADPQGNMKLHCCLASPCDHFLSHRNVKPKQGETGLSTRGSIYPDALCNKLTTSMSRLFSHVRTLPLDPANTPDGSNDRCEACKGAKSGEAFTCSRCPVTYHYKCIPNGHPKPRKCDACRQKKGGKARAGETRDCDQCPEWRCPCSVLVGGVWQLRPPS